MTKDERLAYEQLFKRTEIAHRRNQRAIRATELRGARLERAAQQSSRIVENALRKLRAAI